MQNKDRVLKLRSILNSTNTQDGRKALELLEIKSFDYPKPVKLICELLESFNKKDAIILDFFAGSGTTAQSVIECNNLDGGKRQFILATINEKDDRNPNGIACDTTYPRIKKIINTDSLNVYKIKETNNLSEKIFNEINPEDYEVKDKTTIKNRIE
jgi:adenine-specific DNA-methyltransferase